MPLDSKEIGERLENGPELVPYAVSNTLLTLWGLVIVLMMT